MSAGAAKKKKKKSDDLPGLDVQDGSLAQLGVDAGCQLQAQLGHLSESVYGWALQHGSLRIPVF